MTYPEALQCLESFINYEKRDGYDYRKSFKLDRMRKITSLLNDPQKEIKAIHVAGTKGKGSTAAFIYSILKAAGFKTGLYTSPHLVSFRERIRIDDSFISEEDVARFLERVKEALDRVGEDPPSFFEVYTALAYLYFKEKRADFAVYEVGLGGRLDATNVLEPLVSAIAPISYEHTALLGDTLGQIAYEKAGIIKDGTITVSAPQDEEALVVIERVCREKGAKLILVGRDIYFEETSSDDKAQTFSVFGIFGEYPMLKTGLLGRHQVVNAATAIGVIEGLRLRGVTISCEAVREGIGSARWEGRLEVIKTDPLMVLDGAQNKASAAALALAVKRHFKYRRLILVLGVSKDKDVAGILSELLPISGLVVLTKSNVAERAMEPRRIKELIGDDKEVYLTGDVGSAMDLAMSKADAQDLVLITGSLFVVGEAKDMSNRQYA